MTTNSPITADDGSTSIKLAWFEEADNKTLTVSNAAEFGSGFGDEGDNTYMVEGEVEPITFSASARSMPSDNERYQYSVHSVAAIHYALGQAGFAGQDVNIAVTLPISQFYKDGRKNTDNIERKKQNVLRKVTPDMGDPITIKEVTVFPEGLPAAMTMLVGQDGNVSDDDELHCLVDFGGTTTDICLFEGAAKKIIKADSFNIGMFHAFDAVRSATGIPGLRDNNIKRLLETGETARGKITIDRETVTAPLMNRVVALVRDFLGDDLKMLSNLFVIGGGAELLVKKLGELDDAEPTIIENPTTALAVAISTIVSNQ